MFWTNVCHIGMYTFSFLVLFFNTYCLLYFPVSVNIILINVVFFLRNQFWNFTLPYCVLFLSPLILVSTFITSFLKFILIWHPLYSLLRWIEITYFHPFLFWSMKLFPILKNSDKISIRKEGRISDLCYNMDEPWGCCAMWNKLVWKETHIIMRYLQ